MERAAPARREQVDPRAAELCGALLGVAEEAAGKAEREHAFLLCDQLVTLRVAGAGFEEHLTRALRHARTAPDPARRADLRVFALDSRDAGCPPPPAWPLPYVDWRHLERLHVTSDRSVYVTLDEDTRTWRVFDRASGRAALWTADASGLPDWERSFPLRALLGWLLASSPSTLAHAAVVCAGERGVLLAGAGGSGKSTTTAACLEAGLETCGDDFVAVSAGAPPRAHALFDTLKLGAESLARFPRLAAWVASPAHAEKARIHLSDASPERLRSSCGLEAIVVPRLALGEPTRVAPLSRSAALRALAPTTLFLTRGAETETAAKLGALVRQLPSFELRLGGAPADAASQLRALLAQGSA